MGRYAFKDQMSASSILIRYLVIEGARTISKLHVINLIQGLLLADRKRSQGLTCLGHRKRFPRKLREAAKVPSGSGLRISATSLSMVQYGNKATWTIHSP